MDRTTHYGVAHEVSPIETRSRAADLGAGATDPCMQEAMIGERTAWLLGTIEAEIIPRLMLAHRTQVYLAPYGASTRRGPTSEEIERFANLAISQDPSAALAFVLALQEEGLALEEVYLDLIAPAARRLGALWDADECDFSTVTVGLWRMQQVMYELSPSFQRDVASVDGSRSALMAPAPGSQHTLGLFMVSEFFRRAGWSVSGEPSMSARELIRMVSREWFDVAGLSVGVENHVDGVAQLIADLRQASRNQSLVVLVGGPVFALNPEFLALTGADALAADATQAVTAAEALVAATRSGRC
jgi:MerR family transcriptional regulator, light-induced transcriptional regulator